MLKFIKTITANKKALAKREGRFLTIYQQGSKRTNGKVLKAGLLSSRVQIASTGQVIKVKNSAIRFTIADHALFRADGKIFPLC